MIYRGLYHFYVAHHQGLATDPVKYFAAPENKDLGIIKSIRKTFKKLRLSRSDHKYFPDRSLRSVGLFQFLHTVDVNIHLRLLNLVVLLVV